MRNATAQTKTSRQSSILYATKPLRYAVCFVSNGVQFHCVIYKWHVFAFQLGEPEFSGEEDCEYSFNWVTSLACNKPTPCRIIDPITGFVYGLIFVEFESHVLMTIMCLCFVSVTI